MSDHPVKELGDLTPVQVASTPHMDLLAKRGVVGSMQNTPLGFKAGSDVCNLSLLGYDCRSFHSGRAPYEAASIGIEQKENEIVFRCNFVNIEDGTLVDFSADHIPSEKSSILIDNLNEELSSEGINFYAGVGYRHILKINNDIFPHDFLKIQCTPPHDIMGKNSLDYLPNGDGSHLIRDLMQKAQDILKQNPLYQNKETTANSIWLWGQGSLPQIKPFSEKFSLSGSLISAVDLVKGIGKLAKLEVLDVPGITGYYDTDYEAKGLYALKSLKEKDFIFVHVEATDEAGHNGDPIEKVRAIENVDKKIIGPIIDNIGDDYRVLIAPDHPTPVALRTHTEEYVPFLMAGKGIPKDGRFSYDENILKEKSAPVYDHGFALINTFLTSTDVEIDSQPS